MRKFLSWMTPVATGVLVGLAFVLVLNVAFQLGRLDANLEHCLHGLRECQRNLDAVTRDMGSLDRIEKVVVGRPSR